eukprot:1329344-Amorphochlora_amoeboformis.AAC.3
MHRNRLNGTQTATSFTTTACTMPCIRYVNHTKAHTGVEISSLGGSTRSAPLNVYFDTILPTRIPHRTMHLD